MGRSGVRLYLPVALGLALAACSGDSKKIDNVDPNLFPTNYKKEILTSLSNLFDDPTNVRDAAITDPVLRTAGREQRYTVCVRSNSRNASRVYTGVKERIAYFYGGHLNQLVDATESQCANAAYKPWPELTNYCLAKNCT